MNLRDDGVYLRMRRDEYDALERANISRLLRFESSPLHYQDSLKNPGEDTDALLVGRVTHILVLEPHLFAGAVAVWDGGVRKGKEYEAWCEKHAGREQITTKQLETCEALATAVRESPQAQPFITGGTSEVTMLWTRAAGGGKDRRQIRCKGRIDYIQSVIADLKSTRCAEPRRFGYQAANLFYYAKAAWYSDAYEQLTGERLPYVLVAVESSRPFVVQVHVVRPESLHKGRALYSQWLDRLAFCEANYPADKPWPGYRDGPCDLELPPWAPPVDVGAPELLDDEYPLEAP